MSKIITILSLFFSLFTFGQDFDTASVRKSLIGKWELLYTLSTDSNNIVKDTLKGNFIGAPIGLEIGEKFVDEYLQMGEYPEVPKDSIAYMGKGNWEINQNEKKGKTWVNFNCEGLILCGFYQLMSIKNDTLILRSCSKYKYEGCDLEYLKRR